jgi:hypothetical protein
MLTHFPTAVPEIPVSNVEKAAECYVNVLGFGFDWANDAGIGRHFAGRLPDVPDERAVWRGETWVGTKSRTMKKGRF